MDEGRKYLFKKKVITFYNRMLIIKKHMYVIAEFVKLNTLNFKNSFILAPGNASTLQHNIELIFSRL